MSTPPSTISYSDLTANTPSNFYENQDQRGQTSGISREQTLELIDMKNQPLWKLFGDFQIAAQKERYELERRIDSLETLVEKLTDENEELKNNSENLKFTNDYLVDDLEKMRIDNEKLLKKLKEKWENSKIQEENKKRTREIQDLRQELRSIRKGIHLRINKGFDDNGIFPNSISKSCDDYGRKEIKNALNILASGLRTIKIQFIPISSSEDTRCFDFKEAGWSIQFYSGLANDAKANRNEHIRSLKVTNPDGDAKFQAEITQENPWGSKNPRTSTKSKEILISKKFGRSHIVTFGTLYPESVVVVSFL